MNNAPTQNSSESAPNSAKFTPEITLHVVVAGVVVARITIPESASIRRAASVALSGEQP